MNCSKDPLVQHGTHKSRNLSHPQQDILECLSSASIPLTESQIACNVPWVPNVSNLLEDMTIGGEITAHTVRISPPFPSSKDIPTSKFITIFTPNLPLMESRLSGSDQNGSLEALETINSTIHQTLSQNGLSVLPSQFLPSITADALSGELAALKEVRNKLVDRLASLNEALSLASGSEAEESDSAYSCISSATSFNLAHARLEEHKRSKESQRSEVKELLHILAGVIADHKNVSILDIITEYKNL